MEYLRSGGVAFLLVVPLFPGRAPLEMIEASISPLREKSVPTDNTRRQQAREKGLFLTLRPVHPKTTINQ
jgi:hypothetical protein